MNNSRPSLDSQKPTRALLSIKPQYVAAIQSGEKKYEFRRSTFSRKVQTILIYATTPTQRVVGEFDVLSILYEPLPKLWKHTRQYAGIDKEFFDRYFSGLQFGYAIEIGSTRWFSEPFDPIERFGRRPPQSYVYLDASSAAD